MHAGQCGQVAQEAGVGKLILSHFYPPADHPKVKEQAACRFKGKIQRARDLLAVEL
jgi:ribonuclease BN (tRNA processing enzyme)